LFGTDGVALETYGVTNAIQETFGTVLPAPPENGFALQRFLPYTMCDRDGDPLYRAIPEIQTMEAGRRALSSTSVLALEGDSFY
jgi:hypothetical protein